METFYDPVADMKRQRKQRLRISLWIIAAVLVVLIGFGYIFFGQRISDFFSARSFTPSAEMAAVIKNLDLTDDADLILRAVHPVLQEASEFNQNCPNRDEEMSTLGCFTPNNNRIYVFNVTSPELDGIKESVVAHELLHAIYHRLNNIQRAQLNDELDEYYQQHRSEYEAYLNSYDKDEFYTELHSIIGQRVKSSELSPALRDHYAKYFKNQDEIAGYYAKYRSIFEELSENINQLSDEVETMRADIQKRRTDYDEMATAYNQKLKLYESRVASGYYKTNSEISAAYNELVREQEKIEAVRTALNNDIDVFNEKVEKLNSYIARNNELNSIINSHTEKVEKSSDAGSAN